MRIDHYAYQQATRVTGFGLLLQAVIGLTLLLFGRLSDDTTFQYASYYVLAGSIVWIALLVVFQQHKLERLEALEADELASLRAGASSVFESEGEDLKVAARRLRAMHKWLMPAVSIVVAGLFILLGALILRDFDQADDVTANVTRFTITRIPGWAVALCLFMAAIAFIFSRFVAGMAKQAAWQNLRGGSGIMVGNALVMFGVAVGIIFLFFDKRWVMEIVAKGIAIFMFIVALEITLNFVLNLYRPRRPGEIPRPPFDSKILSLFAAPDSIVRSINEAVNYQFGFDITSSWGYQLLMRSFAWLAAFAAVILVLLNTVVVVQPGEQAIRLRGGRMVNAEPAGPGLMFKLPWPIESARVEQVARIREMALGARSRAVKPLNLWTDQPDTDVELKPFIVSAGYRGAEAGDPGGNFALINAELVMYWRIKPDGLVAFLSFADDAETRWQRLNVREQALRAIALREAATYLRGQPFDAVLSQSHESLGPVLRARIQDAFDRVNTGVEVVAVTVPLLRPPQDAINSFEERSVEVQGRREKVVAARDNADRNLVTEAGSKALALEIVREIEAYQQMRDARADERELAERVIRIEQMLQQGNGRAAATLATAQAERWKRNMAALSRSREVVGDLASFLTAPDLYRQRKIMDVFSRTLGRVRAKFVFGIDPSRIDLDVTLQEPDTGLNISENISDSSAEDEESSQ
jgi:modulator of FtsH protease HflK